MKGGGICSFMIKMKLNDLFHISPRESNGITDLDVVSHSFLFLKMMQRDINSAGMDVGVNGHKNKAIRNNQLVVLSP